MFERIDLHTHSNHSDGVLEPSELVSRAALRRVEVLAVTDHDTLAGSADARAACAAHGIQFVSGVELTCEWRDREVHIVGLKVSETDPDLNRHCDAIAERRRTRMREIGRRLSKAGLPGDSLIQQGLACTIPTRTHVARAMREAGIATTVERAFERWLKRGQPGYVAAQWPDMASVVGCLIGAGGIAVLAHPHRYRVSNGVLRQLVEDFKAAGGCGLEVSLAGMGPRDADRAATLARRFELVGSIGSDFHEPGLPWRPLGRFAKLPDGVAPITARLGLATGGL